MRFLVGWELGGERGHVALISPVVAALRERGHEVAVALKDPGALSGQHSELLQGRVFQAPAWPPPDPRLQWPASETLGDDLTSAVVCREAEVQLRARAWSDLIELCNADAVLAETAPTLLLAARSRCPAVAFGSAYSLPPPGRALPPVLDVQRQPSAASAAREDALRAAYDSVDRDHGGPGLRWFSDLFAVATWVCNLPELDPYGPLRDTPAAGPLIVPATGGNEPANRTGLPLGDKVFVYAKPFPLLPTLMDALGPRCRQIELFVADAPPDVHNPWPHVRLHRAPVDLAARLHEFSAVVHFGGLNLAAEALFAGVPQLILPLHLEQSATAQAVQRLGAGHGQLRIPREPEREAERRELVAAVVERFFTDSALPARATQCAAALRARQGSLAGLVSLCEAVARR